MTQELASRIHPQFSDMPLTLPFARTILLKRHENLKIQILDGTALTNSILKAETAKAYYMVYNPNETELVRNFIEYLPINV